MTLAAEGKVLLDVPCDRYLGQTEITGPNGNPEGVTLRRLGAHVSGLPRMFSAHLPGGPAPAPDAAEVLRSYGRLAYPPGSTYEYSNIGFNALGLVACNLTGLDFGTLMRQRVLDPLGLSDSFFSNDETRLPMAAIGYDAAAKPIRFYTTSTPPSGELYMSAHDLARFAMWNMGVATNGGKNSLLSHRWLEELHKPVFVGPNGVATTFGWFTGSTGSGLQYLFKSGGQPGVATKLYFIPSLSLACLIVTNRTDNTELADSICDEILTLFLPDWRPVAEYAGPQSRPFALTSDFRGRWTGTLMNCGAEMQVQLQVNTSTSASLQLEADPWADIFDLHGEGNAFQGSTKGLIQCNDTAAFGTRKLILKLVPQDGGLVGRVIAVGTKPGLVEADLPYVLSIGRST